MATMRTTCAAPPKHSATSQTKPRGPRNGRCVGWKKTWHVDGGAKRGQRVCGAPDVGSSVYGVSLEDAPANVLQEEEVENELQEMLCRIKEGLQWQGTPQRAYVVSGTGNHLGMDVLWRLSVRPDGAFREEVRGRHLRYSWGHDGSLSTGSVWEVDYTGLPQTLELDDHETTLLCTWVRTGLWLDPERRHLVDMELRKEEDGRMVIDVRLPDGKVTGTVVLDGTTLHPQELHLPVCGDMEKWQYQDWESYLADVRFPRESVHVASAGGTHNFVVDSSEYAAPGSDALLYRIPVVPPVPHGTSYSTDGAWVVPAWRSASGHVLVKPKIDGKEVGLFILDTGASGFVVEPDTANKLDMSSFGELFVAGVGGKVKCQFRQARHFALGHVELEAPLFMEMFLTGVVQGAPEPVVGIVGYDVFRRAVIEVPAESESLGKSIPLRMHVPHEYISPPELKDKWVDLHLVSGVPHVPACFSGAAEDRPQLFMLDSGAGGVGAMFHHRGVEELKLLDLLTKRTSTHVRGVGGEGVLGMKVDRGRLNWLQLGDERFEEVEALFASGGGLDLSLHTCGMLCGDLLAECGVVFDYPRRRIAFYRVE